MKVLFVCLGNTCRSAMAEAIARQEAARRGLEVEFGSAGVIAGEGYPMSDGARSALRELGYDPGSHASRPVTRALIEDYDLILAASEAVRSSLVALAPEQAGKIRLMTEFAGGAEGPGCGDIDDPMGGDEELYLETARLIRSVVLGVLDRLGRSG